MKTWIEAQNSNDVWRYPQTTGVTLKIYANERFQTFDGQIVPASSPFSGPKFWLEVPITISGRTFKIDGFEIDSTEDSPTNPDARYSAFYFRGNSRLGPHLLGFGVPAVLDPDTFETLNQTWTMLELHRDAHPLSRLSTGTFDRGVVEYFIAQALGLLRKGSDQQIGMLALTTPALDPTMPRAVSDADPRLALIAAGWGLDFLVAGSVTVPSLLVGNGSIILPAGQSDNVSGTVRVRNKIPGVSFELVSSNSSDDGEVGWLLYN